MYLNFTILLMRDIFGFSRNARRYFRNAREGGPDAPFSRNCARSGSTGGDDAFDFAIFWILFIFQVFLGGDGRKINKWEFQTGRKWVFLGARTARCIERLRISFTRTRYVFKAFPFSNVLVIKVLSFWPLIYTFFLWRWTNLHLFSASILRKNSRSFNV